MRLERGLEEVRPDRRAPRRRAAFVARRLVVDGDDAALGPGPGQEPDVGAEPLVARRLGQAVERPLDVLGERRGEPALELLEGGGEVRVVLVGVADHQPGRQHDGHRLALGQLERRQERLLGIDPPDAVLTPDRQPELLLERGQVAVDGAHGHPDPGRDVAGPDALGMGLQDRDEPGQPGEPVTLRGVPATLLVDGHRSGG